MSFVSNKKFWLEEQKEKYGRKTALILDDSTVSFEELYERSIKFSLSLKEHGINTDDKVALLFNHSAEFIVAINALWLSGATPVLINTRNKAEEIEHQLKFTDTKILVTDAINYSNINSLRTARVLLFSEFQTHKQFDRHITKFDPEKTALILFTSGSTSKPKAVIHTFQNLYQSTLLTHSVSSLSEENIWLASLPFYHIGGLMILTRALITGAALSVPLSTNYINIKEALVKYNPSHISLVSTTLKQLLDENVKPNSNLRFVYLGGGRLDTPLCASAIEKGFPIIKVYGSTETCSMIAALSVKDFSKKPESVGKPINNVIIKIISEDDELLPPHNPGEIIIQSNTLMKEYYSNQEETLRKLKNGFYHTGDFGWIDNDGYLYIDLRREDLIVTGGENVNPKEVEQFLIQLPSVIDTFVFAQSDDKWGQIVCAAVVSNSNITEDGLKEQLRNMMANYKVPKKIYFLDRIPRNELGKVEKQKLIESLR